MTVSGAPMGVTGLHLVRGVDNDRTLRWVKDRRDGLPAAGVDLTGWSAVFRMGVTGVTGWVYSLACRTTDFGDILIRIPSTAFWSSQWDGRRSGVWRVDVASPDGREVRAAAGGHWLMSDHAGPGDDQIPDLVTLAVPDPVEELLVEVRDRHDQVTALHGSTEALHDDTVRQSQAYLASARQAAQLSLEAARAAREWVTAGQGVSLGVEPPAVRRDGHVWLVESRTARTPLYPGGSTWPGASTFLQRTGWLPDGRHVVTGVRRYDGTDPQGGDIWTRFVWDLDQINKQEDTDD